MIQRLVFDRSGYLKWIALVGVIALATRPFWDLPQYFYSDDGLLHLLRLFAFDRTLGQGVIFPRWLGDLAWGMGYPIFDYYPPLASYLAESLHVLGLNFASSIQISYVIIIAIATCGAYAMGAELFSGPDGPIAGVLTAVVYVFFPYFLIDIYVRGALAEALAASFLPWLLWAWCRMLARPSISTWMFAALSFALVLLAHSLTLLMTAPFLFVFWGWRITATPASARRRVSFQTALAVLFALGLSAFYWLPFVVHLPLVRMGHGLAIIPDSLPAHLLDPGRLVQPEFGYQYGVAPFALGLASTLLALFVLALVGLKRQLRFRATAFVFAILGAIYAGSMVTPMRDLWLAIPVATMIQYPWRLSLLIGLALSLVSGALPVAIPGGLSERLRRLLQSIVVLAAAGIVVSSAIWDLSPQRVNFPEGDLNIPQLARLEEYSGFIGTNTWGEYLPATFQVPTLSAYQAPVQLASQANIAVARYDAFRRELSVSSTTTTPITLRALNFPSWRAVIDDQPGTVYSSTPLGLVTVDVPMGEHQISIFQESTPAQQIGNTVSLSSVFAWLGLLWLSRHEREARWCAMLSVALAALAVLPAKVALFAPVPPIQSTQVEVSPSLRMIGLRVSSAQFDDGTWQVVDSPRELRLQVIWHVRQALADKPLTWQLVDASGKVYASRTQLARYGTGFAATWSPNEIVDDWYDLPLDLIPAGSYTLVASYDNDRPAVATNVQFVRSVPATTMPRAPHVLDVQVGESILLLGYSMPTIAHPGDRLPLELFWQARQNIGIDYTVFAQLHDAHGESVAHMDSIPGGGLGPTSLWVPGKTVADRIDLNLPRELGPGLYHLVAGMYRYPSLKRLAVFVDGARVPDDITRLGEVKIPGLVRGSPTQRLNVSLGSAIQLSGYDFVREKDAAQLTLYWQARSKIDEDYNVFVHMVDENGRIVAQRDRQPEDGHYPTRVWDAGESIVDSYLFSQIPPGRYQIIAGMYSPVNGERLPVLDHTGLELEARQIMLARFDSEAR